MSDCYDLKTNTCDGRCQGCSNCPRARWKRKPSRNEMIQYRKKVEEESKVWKEVMKELEETEEWQKLLKECREIFHGK